MLLLSDVSGREADVTDRDKYPMRTMQKPCRLPKRHFFRQELGLVRYFNGPTGLFFKDL